MWTDKTTNEEVVQNVIMKTQRHKIREEKIGCRTIKRSVYANGVFRDSVRN